MGQRHVCTFRHAQRAAYRTAISAAQILVLHYITLHGGANSSLDMLVNTVPVRIHSFLQNLMLGLVVTAGEKIDA